MSDARFGATLLDFVLLKCDVFFPFGMKKELMCFGFYKSPQLKRLWNFKETLKSQSEPSGEFLNT